MSVIILLDWLMQRDLHTHLRHVVDLVQAGITELDDFGEVPSVSNSGGKGRHGKRASYNVGGLDSFDSLYAAERAERSPGKVAKGGVTPSPGKKKRGEETSDWKQVTNKK